MIRTIFSVTAGGCLFAFTTFSLFTLTSDQTGLSTPEILDIINQTLYVALGLIHFKDATAMAEITHITLNHFDANGSLKLIAPPFNPETLAHLPIGYTEY